MVTLKEVIFLIQKMTPHHHRQFHFAGDQGCEVFESGID